MGTNWIVTTIAGTPSFNGGSADGVNGSAQFHFPYGIAVDAGGNLYVADSQNNTIRKIAPVGTNWVTTTLAGVADGTAATAAMARGPARCFLSLWRRGGRRGRPLCGRHLERHHSRGLAARGAKPDDCAHRLEQRGGGFLAQRGRLHAPDQCRFDHDELGRLWRQPVTTSNGTNRVTITPAAGSLFFRLTK